MNLLPMSAPIRRALSIDEMTAIIARITSAEDLTQLLPIVVVAVYDTLLADLGLSLNSLPKGQQVDPRKLLIPAQQWTAISTAVTDRAVSAGGQPALAMNLVDLLPSTYDDPAAPVPDLTGTDHGPDGLDVSLTREAVGVITAAGHHIQALARHYGRGSREHVTAATTWLSGLAQVISMSSGPRVRVVRDGTLSLLVHTSSGGYTFAVIFHGDARHCIAGDGCTALIADDGTVHAPYATTTVAEHDHEPSFPLDGPRPGSWGVHS
jgi:hypothetical protein